MEANRLEREIKDEENSRRQAAFWKSNPPCSLTTVPEIETEGALFDVLARYHIVKVEYSFDMVEYDWDRFQRIEDFSIVAWLPSDVTVELVSELPDDDEDGRIGNAIYDAIEEFASERAALATNEGRLQEGTVTFDVRDRHIKLDALVEVTKDESIER